MPAYQQKLKEVEVDVYKYMKEVLPDMFTKDWDWFWCQYVVVAPQPAALRAQVNQHQGSNLQRYESSPFSDEELPADGLDLTVFPSEPEYFNNNNNEYEGFHEDEVHDEEEDAQDNSLNLALVPFRAPEPINETCTAMVVFSPPQQQQEQVEEAEEEEEEYCEHRPYELRDWIEDHCRDQGYFNPNNNAPRVNQVDLSEYEDAEEWHEPEPMWSRFKAWCWSWFKPSRSVRIYSI